MSKIVAQFDPSPGAGMFNAGAVNRCSVLWVMNESANFLQFDFGGAGPVRVIQPWYNKRINLLQPANQVAWTVTASLQSGSAPASMVFVELYEPSEDVSDLLSGSIFRQSNVGNAVTTGATSTVQNDGNVAGSTVVEGTPSGAGSSQLLLTNDGKATLGGGNFKVDTTGKLTLPAGAVPVASIGAGALPAGVTMPAAQVGSGYPGAAISGAVASATSATTAAGLSGSIAASQVTPGSFPTGSFNMEAPNAVGSLALLLFSGAVTGGYGHAFQIENGNDNTCASTFGIGDFSQSPFGFGTWLYDQKNGAPVFQGVSSERTVAKRGPLAQMTTNGGGNAGNRLWEGTTDPGTNAGEGDWWAPA